MTDKNASQLIIKIFILKINKNIPSLNFAIECKILFNKSYFFFKYYHFTNFVTFANLQRTRFVLIQGISSSNLQFCGSAILFTKPTYNPSQFPVFKLLFERKF